MEKLDENKLRPAPAADRVTLIRRATFDLIGLPPTPREIDAFVNDPRPNAYEALIDRLLVSPRYGERWGRHWLDVARFAESQGFERDIIRDHAWRYRDYVIQSFNDDKPYDRFVKEQIAGDVLEPMIQGGVIATGFLVAGPYDEAGSGSASALLRARIREEELEDMIGTVGQTFLGVTLNCARCHDHKFDPITQRDYYQFKAALDGVRHGNRPILTPAETQARDAQIASVNGRITQIESRIAGIERVARDKVLAERKRGRGTVQNVPQPMAKWTFDRDAKDELGLLHGTLKGGATVSNGRLQLSGKGAFVETAPLERELREKTLEVWGTLANLTQRGGGLISVQNQDGRFFDSVVFGEREPGKWIAGSNGFTRTRDLAASLETAQSSELVHVAIVYSTDNRIWVYRNGALYSEPYTPTGSDATLRSYPAKESHVLFGLRHSGAGNGYFAGEIEEARLYDRALGPEEVARSFQAGVPIVTAGEIMAALTSDERQDREKLLAELGRQRDAFKTIPQPPLVYAANTRQPEPTYVLARGDVESKKEPVGAGGLSCVAAPSADFGLPMNSPEGVRRVKLAEWIAHADNPLTARAMVNRVWHYHFGRGIVGTPNDLGAGGDRPSHPELLDWLSSEFIAPAIAPSTPGDEDRGEGLSALPRAWSIKYLHKLIMLSNTYQQSSRFDAEAAAVDSENRLLWRFSPRRLEGEAVRDAMLAVSGQINLQAGGPSFRPFELKIFNSHFYNLNDPIGPDYNRRTVYRISVNSAKDPLLDSLDCPDPSTKTPKRGVTTTPLQALGLMNNSFVQRQARHFAERLGIEAGQVLTAQVELAYRLALGRNPRDHEVDRANQLACEQGIAGLCWVLFNSSEFMYLR